MYQILIDMNQLQCKQTSYGLQAVYFGMLKFLLVKIER